MIVLSLYLSKGPERDQYFTIVGAENLCRDIRVSSQITHTRGLRSGLRKQLYALPGGSAGSGHLQLILG